MIIKVQEIELRAEHVFDAERYPSTGFYKVIWAEKNRGVHGSLMFIPESDPNKNFSKVQFISKWKQAGPFVFDDLSINNIAAQPDLLTSITTNDNTTPESKERSKLQERTKTIELLELYSQFLEEQGYTDTDWRTETPYAIDEFMKQLK